MNYTYYRLLLHYGASGGRQKEQSEQEVGNGAEQAGEQGTVPVTGGSIPYEVCGEGHPLVLLHAGVADKSMWDRQMEEFSKHYRVIRYDMRALGDFVTEDVEFSNRQDLYDLLKHLGVSKTYIMGVSRGGQIATDFTLEHPEMVDTLIPVASGLSGSNSPEPTDAEMALFREMEAAEEAKDWERVADLDVKVWVDGMGRPTGRGPEAVREQVRQMCLNNYRKHQVEGKAILLDPPAAGRLGDINVPTLVIVGDRDMSGVIADCDALVEGIPGAKKIVMHDVAHLPPLEEPEVFNCAVLDFLGGLSQ